MAAPSSVSFQLTEESGHSKQSSKAIENNKVIYAAANAYSTVGVKIT